MTPSAPLPGEDLPAFGGAALPEDEGDYFAASGLCASCHQHMVDTAGNDVSIDRQWRGSMMANAARDPYWQASVRAEVEAYPALQAVIEQTCATCHMPLAEETATVDGQAVAVVDAGFLDPQNDLHTFAMDGVSCTACHQIEPDGLGDPASFSGGYTIDFTLPLDERVTYGPFEVTEQDTSLMRRFSGYVPVQGAHIQQSELCATCHMLYTPYVDANHEVAGMFPEQMPYLEWLASDYAETQACQDCHMALVEGEVALSTRGGDPRQGVRQHAIVGGNNVALLMMRAGGEALGVTASSADFDATIAAMVAQMQTETATLTLDGLALDGGTLTGDIVVSALTGHKFPTSFPSRHAWLHVTIQDGAGNVIFESGAYDALGSIAGNANDADPAAYEPHYTTLSQPDQVQIYETILGDTEGAVTTELLAASVYLKDNRILPDGFDKAGAVPDIAVAGEAADDADFVAGSDTLGLSIDVSAAEGPFTVTAELLYQSIGYRWAENLREHSGPEVDQFLALYEQAAGSPIVVASASGEVMP